MGKHSFFVLMHNITPFIYAIHVLRKVMVQHKFTNALKRHTILFRVLKILKI